MSREIIWDIEADNLYPMVTKTWVIVLRSMCGEVNEKLYPFRDGDAGKKFIQLIKDGDTLIGHNILGYDFFAIGKTMRVFYSIGRGIISHDGEQRCIKVIDTLCMSRFLTPDQKSHSLESFGKKLHNDKIDFHDFHEFSERMVTYCEQDVNLNRQVYIKLCKEFEKLYNLSNTTDGYEQLEAYQYCYYLMCAQAFTGVLFDRDLAKQVKVVIAADMEEIRAEVEPQLPPRAMLKGEEKIYTMPAKPFKKDGSMAASTTKFVEKMVGRGHECKLVHEKNEWNIILDGNRYMLKAGQIIPIKMRMELGNQSHMKDWFLTLGWKPTFWNFKKDSDNQFIRVNGQLLPTTPKLQEQGKLCPNLKFIDIDIAKDVVKWLSLRNRHSVITTWINHPRLEVDGRLPAEISGTTPTYRYKHKTVTNVPKAAKNVLYGKEFRSLFCAPEGKLFVGADAAGLEGRCEGHYTAKHDGGTRAAIILDGDVHSANAKLFFPEETAGFDIGCSEFDKEHPDFKPYRSKAKNGAYALAYGCSPKKLAETLGKPLHEAEALYEAFWNGNPSLKSVRDACEQYWKRVGKNKYLMGIDGRFVSTRKKSALVNTLFQSCGAMVMSYACVLVDKELGGLLFDADWKPYYRYKGHVAKRVLFVHDELQFECDEEIAHDVGQIIVDAIIEAGIILKMRVPLGGDYDVGLNWAQTH